MTAYITFRVKRLDDWGQVGQQEAHGKRTGGFLDHCDPERRHLIRYGSDLAGVDAREVGACMRRAITDAGARTRKRAAVGAHLLIIASAPFFRPHDAADVGNEDPERINTFLEAGLAWARRFGTVAAWRVDMDETTPALDVFLVPVSSRTTKTGKPVVEVSYRKAFGGVKHHLSELQTDLAAAMAHLGLHRGRPVAETGARHEPAHILNRRLVSDASAVAKAKTAAETVLAEAGSFSARLQDELERARLLRVAAAADRTAAEEALAKAGAELAEARAQRQAVDVERARAAEMVEAAARTRDITIGLEERAHRHLQAAEQARRELDSVLPQAWAEARLAAAANATEAVRPILDAMEAFRREGRAMGDALARLPPEVQTAGRQVLGHLTKWMQVEATRHLERLGAGGTDPAEVERSIRTTFKRTMIPTLKATLQPTEAQIRAAHFLPRAPRFEEPSVRGFIPTTRQTNGAAGGRGAER